MEKIYCHHLIEVKNPLNEKECFLDYILCNDFSVQFLSENCFTVSNGESYLTAFENGEIKFKANKVRDWEKFYILDQNSIIFCDLAIKKRLKDSKKNQIEETSLIIFDNKIHIALGADILTPSYMPPSIIEDNFCNIKYKTLNNSLKLSYRKELIYFCVYGKQEYYDCFKLALESLIKFGKYTGDILIKCDNLDLVKKITNQYENSFFYSKIDESYGIFNRYHLNEDILNNYDSIVYFDSDILTINNIYNFFSRIDSNSDLVVYNEFNDEDRNKKILSNNSWFGLNYVSYISHDCHKYVLNSGFFIINNLNKVKPIFNRVLAYSKWIKKYGDQPFLNISLYNSDLIVTELKYDNGLAFSRSLYEFYKNLDKSLIHFNSGVGNLSKLDLLTDSFKYLNKDFARLE